VQREAWELLPKSSKGEIENLIQMGYKQTSLRVRTVTLGDAVALDAYFGATIAAGVVESFEMGAAVEDSEGVSRTTAKSTINVINRGVLAVNNDYKKAGGSRASIDSKEAFFRWPLRDYTHRPKLRRPTSRKFKND